MNAIKLLILDVDGVLTDGRVVFGLDATGSGPGKSFAVQDGSAIQRWEGSGRVAAILSGRDDPCVSRRMGELGLRHVRTGVKDKLDGFRHIVASVGCPAAQVAYMGDDLPDLAAMRVCGLPIAVANARPEVKRLAVYVTRRGGGNGAVAEAVDRLLRWSGGLSSAGNIP